VEGVYVRMEWKPPAGGPDDQVKIAS
jgi:hypothetical protein